MLGFALRGVAPVQPSQWADHLRAWLASGKHGSMEYLSAELDVRLSPERIFQGTRSFIVVGDQYARRGDPDRPRAGLGRIARYARGRNYHEVMKKRLHSLADDLRAAYPGSDFRTCVDTAPLLERELAHLAGLGWVGKNTMLIHPRVGSYFVLGVVATNLELQPAAAPTPDHCGTCTRCIDACPTNAITPYSVDGSRCISYLTIERRDQIPPGFHAPMGDWIFGCDVCQEVCPHNSERTGEVDVGSILAAYQPRRNGFDLLDVLGWTVQSREEAFRSSAMKRAGLALMKRNALIAAGNSLRDCPDPRLLARIRELAADDREPGTVRATALDVLEALAA